MTTINTNTRDNVKEVTAKEFATEKVWDLGLIKIKSYVLDGVEWFLLSDFTKQYKFSNVTSLTKNACEDHDMLSVRARSLGLQGNYARLLTEDGFLDLICTCQRPDVVKLRKYVIRNFTALGFGKQAGELD